MSIQQEQPERTCPACGQGCSPDSLVCPACHKRLPKKPAPLWLILLLLAVIVVLLVAISVVAFQTFVWHDF